MDLRRLKPGHRNNMAEWPAPLVFSILDALLEPIDHLRFAAVCKHWRFLAKYYNHSTQRWRKVPPMLMIPSTIPQENITKYNIGRLYSVFEDKFYDDINIHLFPMPASYYCKTVLYGVATQITSYCVGCGPGWLAEKVYDTELRDFSLINIFNPFRKEGTIISLPHLKQSCPEDNIKVIMSGDLALNQDNYVIISLTINKPVLSFIIGGQKDWTYIEKDDEGCIFSDAIFYKGQVYAVDNHLGMIVSFDVRLSNSLRRHQAKIDPTTDMASQRSIRAYLVESTNGDLLHVRRFLIKKKIQVLHNEEEYQISESFFMIYKLVFDDSDGSIVQQVEVKSIEDEALFVGDHSPSMSFLASKFLGCQPNSIYYINDSGTYLDNCLLTQDELVAYRYRDEVPFDYHMAGVFSLENRTTTQLYFQTYELRRLPEHNGYPLPPPAPAVWFTLLFNGLCYFMLIEQGTCQ